MAKIIIAGLPNAGKTSYIAALSYLLEHPVSEQVWSIAEKAKDMTYINKLIGNWLALEIVDRTSRNQKNNIELRIVNSQDNSNVALSFVDVAGEDYAAVIKKQTDIYNNIASEVDGVLYLINDWSNHTLPEQFNDMYSTSDAHKQDMSDIISFDESKMTAEVRNILLLKDLRNAIKWDNLVIGLSSYDKYIGEAETPSKLLKQKAPFLYNFLEEHFPNTKIIGISAQGAEYPDLNDKNASKEEDLFELTKAGKRSFIAEEGKDKRYDLTYPIDLLIGNEL